jgi:ribosome-binding protein aMBF1 (putative translation factor)
MKKTIHTEIITCDLCGKDISKSFFTLKCSYDYADMHFCDQSCIFEYCKDWNIQGGTPSKDQMQLYSYAKKFVEDYKDKYNPKSCE